ncbi:MAG: hypothetical protein ACE5D0_08425 [Fidelibacterota bacterium]
MKNRNYNFIFVLECISNIDDTDVADILFESGCDDATLSVRDQVAYLEFDRKSNSLQEAIVSALTNVLDADIGVRVNAIDPGDYVTSAEIARRINKTRQYIQKLKTGKDDSNIFPAPIAGLQSGTLIYSWSRISFYFYGMEKYINREDLLNAQLLKIFNDILESNQYLNKTQTDRHILRKFQNPKIFEQIVYP